MQTVQLAIADVKYEAALRQALIRSGPWHVESVAAPSPGERCVLVMDEVCLNRVRLPLPYPERVVLLTRKDPVNLSNAWEAGIVSLVFPDDSQSTVLLAIMAAALRVPKPQTGARASVISPSTPVPAGPMPPHLPLPGAKP